MAVTDTTPSHSQHEEQQIPPQHDHHFQLEHNQNLQQKVDQKLPENDHEESGTSPELVVYNNVAGNLVPTPAPPMNRRRLSNKRGRKTKTGKHNRPTKRLRNLINDLNPIPFIPKMLNFGKHEEVLKRLGLYDFSILDLDREIRTDLLAQLIANYDQKKKCSYVNGYRINVNRAVLAKALMLPSAKHDKESSIMEVDLVTEAMSNEVIGFIEDFVFNFMLLHEESWELPVEIVNWTSCIRDGHPEKLDSASLIWYKVEKELSKGDKLVDCYYASHLQFLIRSQRNELFIDDDDDGPDVAREQKEVIVQEDSMKMVQQEVKEDDFVDGGVVREESELIVSQEDVKMVQVGRESGETMVEAEECKEEVVEKRGNRENDSGERILQRCQAIDLNAIKEISVEEDEGVQTEHAVDVEEGEDGRLTFLQGLETSDVPCSLSMDLTRSGDDLLVSLGGKSVIEVEEDTHCDDDKRKWLETIEQSEVRESGETMVEAEDCKEEVVEKPGNWKNDSGEQILQRCHATDLNGYEAITVDEDEGAQTEQAEDVEEDEDVRFVAGLDMTFLQGLESSDVPCSSSMDLTRSRDYSLVSRGGKRVIEVEEDTQPIEQSNFGFCMVQIEAWMENAKMARQSREQDYVNSEFDHHLAMKQLQHDQQITEMIMKSKDEALKKKQTEAVRLNRELYLMQDLLAGYKKSLNDLQGKFSEYRKRFPLKEEPLYKDAGPGGLVLSTRELEKQRLKREEMMRKFQTYEQQCIYHLDYLLERVLKMSETVGILGNEVGRLKEIATERKTLQKPEENQNSKDEVPAVVLRTESVFLDAHGSQEKGVCEEH